MGWIQERHPGLAQAPWLSGCSCKLPRMNHPGRVSHLPPPQPPWWQGLAAASAAFPHPLLGTATGLSLLGFLQGKGSMGDVQGLGEGQTALGLPKRDCSALYVPSQVRCCLTTV